MWFRDIQPLHLIILVCYKNLYNDICAVFIKKRIYFIFFLSFKGGWLKVEWDMDSSTIHQYRYGSNRTEKDKYDVKVCDEPRLLENQLIATGCLVTRGMNERWYISVFKLKKYFYFIILCFHSGPDWSWHDQDGGVGNVGSVISVRDSGGVLVCID